MIPQLDGPVSVQSRSRRRISENARIKQESFEGLLHHIGENIQMKVVMILIVMGDHMMIRGPLKEEGTKVRVEGHQIEEIIKIEDILEEGIQIEVEDPWDEGDPLIMEDPLMMEDP